jgi:type IV pilus biogenesis protein CpaD/CtpE
MKTSYLLVLSAALIGLAACANKPAEPVSTPSPAPTARIGSTLETILAAQVANPEASEANNGPLVTQGPRAVIAVQSYQKGETKALVRERTSSGAAKGGGK